jgi:hypothetical protein
MLLGRAVERNAIDRVLESGRQGCGAALMLRGEPGVGKTALLSYAREGATGYRVLMATAVETEVDLPFAALHQLLGKELGRVDRLPAPQASAVRAAFGLARAEHRDSFLISLGVLGLLADAAEEQPALCVVDDTQWLDEPSAAVLLFVARRIENERMVLLGAMRAGEQEVSPRTASGSSTWPAWTPRPPTSCLHCGQDPRSRRRCATGCSTRPAGTLSR